MALYKGISFDTFGPLHTVTAFRQPPTVAREELLIRKAISDHCLNQYEKGYEHLPEVDDDDIRAAEKCLDEYGDDLFESEAGKKAFAALEQIVQQKQAEQFTNTFAPTLPPEIAKKREIMIGEIQQLLSQCRDCEHWDDRGEYKLPSWLDHVPEEMIPFTSIPNLLRIRENVSELLERIRNTAASSE